MECKLPPWIPLDDSLYEDTWPNIYIGVQLLSVQLKSVSSQLPLENNQLSRVDRRNVFKERRHLYLLGNIVRSFHVD